MTAPTPPHLEDSPIDNPKAADRAAPPAGATGRFVGLGVGEAAARLIAFVTMLIIARRLGTEGLGVIAFATAVLLYLQRVVDAGFDLGIGIREAAARQGELSTFVPPVLALRSAIAVGVSLLASVPFLVAPSLESRMVALYSLTLFPLALGTRWVLTAIGDTRTIALSRAAGEGAVLLVAWVAVTTAADAWRMPVAQLTGDTLAALVLLVALRRHQVGVGPRWNPEAIRPLVRHMAPYVGSALLGLAIFNSDLLFIRAFRDRPTVGLYAAAYALVSFLINVGATYSLSLVPAFTTMRGEPVARSATYAASWVRAVAIVLPIAVGGAMIATPAMTLVFGREFAPAGPVLVVLMVSVPLSVLRSIATAALMAERREDILLRTVFLAAAANVAMNLFAVPKYGMLGAAAVTVVTEVLRTVLAQWHAARLGFRAPTMRRHWRASLATIVMAGVLATGITGSPVASILLGAVAFAGVMLALGAVRRGEDGGLEFVA